MPGAGFGAAFGPVILISLYWQRMTKNAALWGMLAGAAVVIIWISVPFSIGGQRLSSWLYEIVPGFIVSSAVIYLLSISSNDKDSESATLFARGHKAMGK